MGEQFRYKATLIAEVDVLHFRNRRHDLPRREEIAMEQRRETFGYSYAPKDAAPDQPPAD